MTGRNDHRPPGDTESRPTPNRFAPAAVFQLALQPGEMPPDLRLRSAEWGLLFTVTGRHTVAQLGAMLRIDRARLEEALVVLLERGLVAERTLSLDEYLAAAAAVGDTESVTLAEFLRARARSPRDLAEVLPPPADSQAAALALDDAPFEPLPLPEIEERAMTKPQSPSPSGAARALSLQALIQALLQRAATPDAGQLDVYRTFLRIEPQLLRRNGITTLRFEDDRVVRDPELVAAIAASAAETLGGALPDTVYGS